VSKKICKLFPVSTPMYHNKGDDYVSQEKLVDQVGQCESERMVGMSPDGLPRSVAGTVAQITVSVIVGIVLIVGMWVFKTRFSWSGEHPELRETIHLLA